MANNRLYLVHPRLKLAVRLGTHHVGAIYWTAAPGISRRLNRAFEETGDADIAENWDQPEWIVQHEGNLTPDLRHL